MRLEPVHVEVEAPPVEALVAYDDNVVELAAYAPDAPEPDPSPWWFPVFDRPPLRVPAPEPWPELLAVDEECGYLDCSAEVIVLDRSGKT